MSEPKAVTPRARAAFEYAMLEERLGFARAALEDVQRQLDTFNDANRRAGGDMNIRLATKAREGLNSSKATLAHVAITVAVLGS